MLCKTIVLCEVRSLITGESTIADNRSHHIVDSYVFVARMCQGLVARRKSDSGNASRHEVTTICGEAPNPHRWVPVKCLA